MVKAPVVGGSGWLGAAAMAYVAVDYLRNVSPALHSTLQPLLWGLLAVAAVARVPFYRHWDAEIRSAIPFVFSLLFMLAALVVEALAVQFVTGVLGLDWHRTAPPLPDTGQWLFLALNEKLPPLVVEILRAHIITLHHYLMLFLMLAFSVLFDSVKAPGLGLGARYTFTMAVGRLLRVATFLSTILPSARPWCASARFRVPNHPHLWAQKYYTPYTSDIHAIRQLLHTDTNHAQPGEYIPDYRPDWGSMSFLIDILRPIPSVEGKSWFSTLKRTGGGCNDLVYSGHMFVAVLTAMAWTGAYGGWTSVLIWVLVLHSAQREIRERHHYSVDCVVAIYVGILLWRISGFLWSARDAARMRRLGRLDEVQGRLIQAAKDADLAEIRDLLEEVERAGQDQKKTPKWMIWTFACLTIVISLGLGLTAFTLTTDG